MITTIFASRDVKPFPWVKAGKRKLEPSQMNLVDFRQKVRTKLIEREWSQHDLSRAIDRNPSTVNRAIKHQLFPTVVKEIADVLGINIAEGGENK